MKKVFKPIIGGLLLLGIGGAAALAVDLSTQKPPSQSLALAEALQQAGTSSADASLRASYVSGDATDVFSDDAKGAVSGGAVDGKPEKIGLVKKSGDLYFYRNGEPVRDTLIKTGGDIFYFGNSGRALTKRWRMINDDWYYFKEKGRAAVGSVKIKGKYRIFNKHAHLCTVTKQRAVQVKKKRFLVEKDGYAAHGWFSYKGRMLHTRKNGAFDKRKRCGYIPMNKKGFAKNGEQVQAMLLARAFIRRHTDRGDSPMRKFEKCFHVIMAGTQYIGNWRPQGFGEKGWQYRSAIEMFTFGLMGDCYGVSCAVAAVAKDLGFQPYVIWAASSHAFVIVDGKYYDNMHGAKFGTTTHDPYTVKEKFKF